MAAEAVEEKIERWLCVGAIALKNGRGTGFVPLGEDNAPQWEDLRVFKLKGKRWPSGNIYKVKVSGNQISTALEYEGDHPEQAVRTQARAMSVAQEVILSKEKAQKAAETDTEVSRALETLREAKYGLRTYTEQAAFTAYILEELGRRK